MLRQLGVTRRERVLVVGDNLSTDIRGALDCGLPAAWYNPRGLPNTTPWTPRWTISDYTQLEELVLAQPSPLL